MSALVGIYSLFLFKSFFLDEQTFLFSFSFIGLCLCVFNQVKLLMSGATVGMSLVIHDEVVQSVSIDF